MKYTYNLQFTEFYGGALSKSLAHPTPPIFTIISVSFKWIYFKKLLSNTSDQESSLSMCEQFSLPSNFEVHLSQAIHFHFGSANCVTLYSSY